MAAIFGPDGKLHAAPELIIEVLSPGAANEKRDREAKLKLYSRRGVEEYWIVDWRQRRIEIFRREQAQLALAATVMESDILTSPLLPGGYLSAQFRHQKLRPDMSTGPRRHPPILLFHANVREIRRAD